MSRPTTNVLVVLFGTILLDELHHGHLGLVVVNSRAPVARLVLLPHEAAAFPPLGASLETAPDEGLVGLPLATVSTQGTSGMVLGSHVGGDLVGFVVVAVVTKRRWG